MLYLLDVTFCWYRGTARCNCSYAVIHWHISDLEKHILRPDYSNNISSRKKWNSTGPLMYQGNKVTSKWRMFTFCSSSWHLSVSFCSLSFSAFAWSNYSRNMSELLAHYRYKIKYKNSSHLLEIFIYKKEKVKLVPSYVDHRGSGADPGL